MKIKDILFIAWLMLQSFVSVVIMFMIVSLISVGAYLAAYYIVENFV